MKKSISTTNKVTVQLPAQVYTELLSLKTDGLTNPVEIIAFLVKNACAHRAWLRDLAILREQIRKDGGILSGVTKEDLVERLRHTRREIFDEEYADLYR